MKTLSVMFVLCFLNSLFSQTQINNQIQQIISPEQWKINQIYGGENNSVLINTNEGKFILTGSSGMIITSNQPIQIDTEISIALKFSSPKRTTVSILTGLRSPDDTSANPYGLGLTYYPDMNPQFLLWSLPPLPGEKYGLYGNYCVMAPVKNRLNWPEMVRWNFDKEISTLTPIDKKWIRIRYVLRQNCLQVWLDDRLLREIKGPSINPAGFIKIYCYEGVAISSIKINHAEQNTKFEPIPIDGYTNAGDFPKNDRIAKILILHKENRLNVGNIPFLLASDHPGRNHVDIGKSWAIFGLLEGAFDGWSGEVPRWRGALYIEPGRIQFRVPNAQYTKIHLIAAADDIQDTVPVVTAVFYRPNAGHPLPFQTKVPLYKASSTSTVKIPFVTEKGKRGNLYLITIPLLKEGLKGFSDLPYLEFELTKNVSIYRSFPDPIYYSMHQAGLPSSVHVFAITLEKADVEVDFVPSQFAHIWVCPDEPSYTCNLSNVSNKNKIVSVSIKTQSFDKIEKTAQTKKILVPAKKSISLRFMLKLNRFGYHKTEFSVIDGQEKRVFTGSLAYLHPDTRERGEWKGGKGQIFGFWDWNGGHDTPSGIPRLEVMVKAGVESCMRPFIEESTPETELKYLINHKMKTYFLAYQLHMTKEHIGIPWDSSKPDEMKKAIIEAIKKSPLSKPTKINEPELAVFYAEPLIGPISYISLPEFYGDPPYQMTSEEKSRYEKFLQEFIIAASAIKKEWPQAKCLLPWGIPSFPIPFLRYSKEATELMDGPALDVVLFERIPEMQMHQVTFASVMWQLKQEWLKTGKKWPELMSIEGPSVSPSIPGALTPQEEADHTVRAYLILMAYNTTRHFGCPAGFQCAGAWGETHYGGGLCNRIPLLYPKPVYCAYATLTRQTNRMKYSKMIHTGSNTVFCLQFKHYKTGKTLHVLWTIRGTRQIMIDAQKGTSIQVYDSMDNPLTVKERNGKYTITISSSPVYVWGIEKDPSISLGQPNHSDAKPSKYSIKIGNLGNGSWRIISERDMDYENVHTEFVKKFLGNMKASITNAPSQQGATALSISFSKQEKERKTMPYYTTIVPEKPIVIPGKPSHLGLWIKANSDWGRIVYCLRDAKGEKWISNGKNGEWNVDDVHCASMFCFDGWRYLRFELPGNHPYDCFREPGTCWWGNYGGDGIVDLPLSIEKIFVERRTHVIVGDELMPANMADTLFADLYAEYACNENKTDEAIRLSKLRMPVANDIPEIDNPIVKFREAGVFPSTEITSITIPEREYDGTKCHVWFKKMENANLYEIWVSPYENGAGAICLGEKWTEPGGLLTGLNPDTDLYIFVIYRDKNGSPSKPSNAFHIKLKDMFPMK